MLIVIYNVPADKSGHPYHLLSGHMIYFML